MEDKEINVEEEKKEVAKKKNKLWILIICLLVVVLGIGGFSIKSYVESLAENDDKNEENTDKNSNNEEQKDDQSTDKEEGKYSGMYIIVDGDTNKVYSANINEYLTEGKKSEILNDIYEYSEIKIYKNQIFYINKNLKLSVYNVDTKKTDVYDCGDVVINANTVIMPGDDYTILSDVTNCVRLDMKTKEIVVFKVNTNNYTLLYDDSTKILYYMNNYNLESYNVVSGVVEKGVVKGTGHPVHFDSEYVYIDRDAGDGKFYLDLYNKETKQIISLEKPIQNYTRFLNEYNGDRYFVDYGYLFKVDKNNKLTVISVKECTSILNTNRSAFIIEHEAIYDDVGLIAGDIEVIYEYDYETGTKEIVNNQYLQYLDDNIVYYIEK